MEAVLVTKSLLAEIQQAMDANRRVAIEGPPVTDDEGVPFGSVYFGHYTEFAIGEHHGMAATAGTRHRGRRSPQGVGPLVPFCPITSMKQSGRGVVRLPHGTLPPKRGPRGEYLLVMSYLLLFIVLPVGRHTLRSSFRYVSRLGPEIRERALRLLLE